MSGHHFSKDWYILISGSSICTFKCRLATFLSKVGRCSRQTERIQQHCFRTWKHLTSLIRIALSPVGQRLFLACARGTSHHKPGHDGNVPLSIQMNLQETRIVLDASPTVSSLILRPLTNLPNLRIFTRTLKRDLPLADLRSVT